MRFDRYHRYRQKVIAKFYLEVKIFLPYICTVESQKPQGMKLLTYYPNRPKGRNTTTREVLTFVSKKQNNFNGNRISRFQRNAKASYAKQRSQAFLFTNSL